MCGRDYLVMMLLMLKSTWQLSLLNTSYDVMTVAIIARGREGGRVRYWPVPVDDGIEGETIPPWLGEVLDMNSRILVGRFLGPSQQSLLGSEVLLADNNIRNLERKQDISYLSSVGRQAFPLISFSSSYWLYLVRQITINHPVLSTFYWVAFYHYYYF